MSANEKKDPDLDFGDDDDLLEAGEAGDFEFEVEDTTPEEDRGRPVAADVTVDDDEDEEMAAYSEKVQRRIKTETAKRHDERRAKEAAVRERDAAANYARQLHARNQQLEAALTTSASATVTASKAQAESEVASLKEKLKEAADLGDGEKVAEFTVQLQSAALRLHQAVNAEQELKRRPAPQVVNAPQAAATPQVSQKTREWCDRNKWFGTNDDMTALAMGVHQRILKSGVAPESEEYYTMIDAEVRKRFPEEFKSNNSKRGSSPPVAGVTRRSSASANGKRVVRLTEDEAAVARRLGVSLKDYARQKALLEAENG